jgi:hypothetical protein
MMPLTGEIFEPLPDDHSCENHRNKELGYWGAPNGAVWLCDVCGLEWVFCQRKVGGIGVNTWYRRDVYEELLDKHTKI